MTTDLAGPVLDDPTLAAALEEARDGRLRDLHPARVEPAVVVGGAGVAHDPHLQPRLREALGDVLAPLDHRHRVVEGGVEVEVVELLEPVEPVGVDVHELGPAALAACREVDVLGLHRAHVREKAAYVDYLVARSAQLAAIRADGRVAGEIDPEVARLRESAFGDPS